MPPPPNSDLYKSFKFRVVWDGHAVLGVSKASTLERTTDVVDYREGGANSTDHKMPGRTGYEGITLERGVTHDLEFAKWAKLGQSCSEFKSLPDPDANANTLAIERMQIQLEGWERDA